MPVLRRPFKTALRLAAALFLTGGVPVCAEPTAAVLPWNSPDAATERFETPDFLISLQSTSQTLVSLAPKGQGGFDFAPSGRFTQRLGDGNYRLGDIDLRVRLVGSDAWQDYSSAFKRAPVKALKVKALKVKGALASADITPSLNGIPLKVTRTWRLDRGQLVLSFTLSNPGKTAVEIGGLGLPMIFDNIITDRTLDEAHEQASFYDPYVGRDAGYLQVTRLNGHGPALLVLPEKHTPFELYKPILDHTNPDHTPVIYNDPMRRGMVFEGFYDWMVASKGFADTDWKGIQQWNETTSLILRPGETRTIGLRFVLSRSIRAIEDTLEANKRPVAVGLPGYMLPTDMPADLFLKASSVVQSIDVFPSGAVDIGAAQKAKDGWAKYVMTGKTEGRARVTITYANGDIQTVHYLVTKPEQQVVADMGSFLTTKQWFDDKADPFHRGPSIMTYDRDAQRIVTDDTRVWVSGLSDEGGAGSYLATAMKELDNPDPEEVAKFETFANQTLWGKIQVADGEHKYGVHKSLFYYEPKLMPPGTYDPAKDWSTWSSWNREGADDLGRSFNYVHVAAAWWSLYRLARYHDGMATQESWQTYLTRAEGTIVAMMRDAPYYTQFGQMEGNVFLSILTDLRREGMTDKADTVETLMKGRADHWAGEKYPFGSEMPWDSTGQPEVYEWLKYFHYNDRAASTREVILAYDPTLPHWGYNGSARRFWDFLYAGKKSRIERQLHHYGSANNALPLFESYREDPKDFYLLRVAYGGLMGSLSNIDDNGFGSAAFHSFPDAMTFDAITGDYGTSFFAHAYSVASYLVDHPTFGWVGFGGTVTETDGKVILSPKDSARTRVFVAPAGLWLTLDAGKVHALAYDPKSGRVDLTLEAADAHTPAAYVNLATTTADGKPYAPVMPLTVDKGAYTVKLGTTPQTVSFSPASR